MQNLRIDRSQIIIAKRDLLDNIDNEYWNRAAIEEKLEKMKTG